MLDQQKISMGRVRQAYGLTANEVEKVIQALWPDAVFPVELWRRVHETVWRAFADSNQALYNIESPALPKINLSDKHFHAHPCALDVMTFFRKLSLNIQASALREGLNFILEESYEDIDAVFPKEREFLFNTLLRLETVDIFDQYSPDSELFEEKILSLPISSYHFVSNIFPDTMLVDTVAVIRHLRNCPLRREVKGITHALVRSILDPLVEKTPNADISTSQPQMQATAPRSTGSKKDIGRIKATRQACEEVIKELHLEKQAFENNKNDWKHSLIFDNGKTNWKTFRNIVEARLGSKPHHETAREEWKKVPDSLNHKGRMRDQ